MCYHGHQRYNMLKGVILMSYYTPHEFADMIGISVETLKCWDNDGKLKAYRSLINRPYYTHKQYVDYIIENPMIQGDATIYTRMSTPDNNIGGGLNYDHGEQGEHKFTRLGFKWFDRFLQSKGVEITVANNEKLSTQEESANDLKK